MLCWVLSVEGPIVRLNSSPLSAGAEATCAAACHLLHNVSEDEATLVLSKPGEDRAGREGSRVAIGRTSSGRCLRVVCVLEIQKRGVFVITAMDLSGKALHAYRRWRRRRP